MNPQGVVGMGPVKGPVAPYPTAMYPATSFWGAAASWLQPSTAANAAGKVDPNEQRNMVVVIGVVVVLGFLAFHYNFTRG